MKIYLIIDTSSGKMVENAELALCNLIENSMRFVTRKEAEQFIAENNISDWAIVSSYK